MIGSRGVCGGVGTDSGFASAYKWKLRSIGAFLPDGFQLSKGKGVFVSCLLALHFWYLSLSMQFYSSLSSLSMILYLFKCGVFLVQAGQHM